MKQYIVVFPTTGDSQIYYPETVSLPITPSVVCNYRHLQIILTKAISTCNCPNVQLFLPTAGVVPTYKLCNSLEEVEAKAVQWKLSCPTLVPLPPYSLELSQAVIPGSKFFTTAITEIFEIKVQLHPLFSYTIVSKWKKPVAVDCRIRSGSTDSITGFLSSFFVSRTRSNTQ